MVADGEFADLIDLVAEELHAQRPLSGGREDVDDAAAHGEFAPSRDHVDARVGEFRQSCGEVVDLGFVADGELGRRDVPQPLRHGLEECAHGRKDETQLSTRAGVGQAAEHLEALADGVRAWGQLFVRQRLPAGEDRDGGGWHPVGERLGEVFGLTGRGGDDELRRRGCSRGADRPTQDRRPQSLDRINPAPTRVRVVEGGDESVDGGVLAGEIKSVEHPNSLGHAPDTAHPVSALTTGVPDRGPVRPRCEDKVPAPAP